VTHSVLIADDHTRTRAMVREALERSTAFTVAAEVADAEAAIAAARTTRPDVCLLDINMPGNGISAASAIAEELPGCAIVMLTVSRQDTDLFDALRAGASGYLLKDLDEEQLVGSLRRVLAGEACLPGSLVARLVEEFRDREHRRIPIRDGGTARLTGREWDVLELMRSGASTGEIAERLFVSQTTVRTHVSAILKKLHVQDRRAALELLDQGG
jgi:DNA-binding NarL/FixJ family response regulator